MNADLGEVRNELAELKAGIRPMTAEVKADLRKFKADLLKWILGALCVQTVIIVSAFAWFIKRIAQ